MAVLAQDALEGGQELVGRDEADQAQIVQFTPAGVVKDDAGRAEELEAFEAAISVAESVVDEDRRLVEQLRDTIQTAMLELVEYGRQNLRVAD